MQINREKQERDREKETGRESVRDTKGGQKESDRDREGTRERERGR